MTCKAAYFTRRARERARRAGGGIRPGLRRTRARGARHRGGRRRQDGPDREVLRGRAASTTVLRGVCDALFTPRPLGPIHDFAPDAGPSSRELLLGEAIPYQVAAALFEELRRNEPTVLVIEDVHWADEATLDVLRLIARRIETIRVLIVLSYRDEAVDATSSRQGHARRAGIGLASHGWGSRRSLRTPSRSSPSPTGSTPNGLHQVTGGNPFFVTEVLASGGTRDTGDRSRRRTRARSPADAAGAKRSSRRWRSRHRRPSCGSWRPLGRDRRQARRVHRVGHARLRGR